MNQTQHEMFFQEAMDANDDLRRIFDEEQIRKDWALSRGLVAIGMRADGRTYREIGERFSVSAGRASQITIKTARRARRLLDLLKQP